MVVATSTDYGYLDITKNWICHLKRLGLEQEVIVFSLDEKIHAAVQGLGIRSYFEKGMAKTAQDKAVGNWNSKSYNQVVHTKTKHQRAVLVRGFNLFFSDIDIPWTSDLRVQLRKDTPPGVDFVGQQNWPQNDMNVGFFFARSSPTMIEFFTNVLSLELKLERREIPIGMDPRKDIFDPSDDQSAIAFHLICGAPNGSYPGRPDGSVPQGGRPPEGAKFMVQPKWQRMTLYRKHVLTNRKLRTTHQSRVFDADCTSTTGYRFKYAYLPPLWYQTGHKDYFKFGFYKHIISNMSVMYHPNFMKGKTNKINVLKEYGRWIECEAT